jgi:hypothetical protein
MSFTSQMAISHRIRAKVHQALNRHLQTQNHFQGLLKKKLKPTKLLAFSNDLPSQPITRAPVANSITKHTILCERFKRYAADEEINRLIKKLTLSFTAKKHESEFLIGQGIFKGTRFHVITNESELSMTISKASPVAQRLLGDNKDLLANRLLDHALTLRELMFIS